jgi:hypothetical protein
LVRALGGEQTRIFDSGTLNSSPWFDPAFRAAKPVTKSKGMSSMFYFNVPVA